MSVSSHDKGKEEPLPAPVDGEIAGVTVNLIRSMVQR
jgi:hypothetical protein